MKRFFSFVILAVALALPSIALAQGSGTTSPKAKKKDPAFEVTRTLNGKVVAVKTRESLVIETDGARQEFKITKETKLPSGLKKGDEVKVTYRGLDHTATEVQKANSAT
jgi:hypothetical protein